MNRIFTTIKTCLLLLSLIFTSVNVSAQNVGINATGATPDVSAMLDITNANKGLLIPRVSLSSSTDALTIATPATSLLVYNNNASMTNGQGVGYYYNSGTTLSPLWIKLSAVNEAWLLRGNTGINDPAVPATYGSTTIGATENFLGTTDAQDVVFGTNNIERFRIKQTTGYTGIGLSNPLTKLNISGGNWDVENGIGDFHVGDGTYRFKLGLATGGGGAGDVRMTSHGGTNRIFIGGGTNSEVVTVDGTNQSVGIKNNISPSSSLDVNGDLALREGPAIALPAATTYPIITLTAGAEYSHYRLTGGTIPFWLYLINGGNDGQVITLINNSASQPMNIYNWNVANGIITGTGNHLTSTAIANSSVTMIYNATLQRWIVTGYTGMTDNNDWHITGNTAIIDPAVPATYGTTTIATTENWAGTTDANDYVIGTNTIERLRVKQTNGRIGIGTAIPGNKLHIKDSVAGATITYSENVYQGNSSGIGVHGISENAAGYGTGGLFEGGLYGVRGLATLNPTTAAGNRYGGYFTGWFGSGTNYGSYNYGYGGTTAYGIYATSSGGSTQSIGAYIDGTEYGVIVPTGGGLSGFGTNAPEQRLSVSQGANIDQSDLNAGTTALALTFGSGSGEGIGSKRTAGAGTNQYGLDFYQGFANRMRIWNDGRVGIGQSNLASLLPTHKLWVKDPSAVDADINMFSARNSGAAGSTWEMGSVEYYTEGYDNIGFSSWVSPLGANGGASLGSNFGSNYDGWRWGALYANNGTIQTSDTSLKTNIKPISYGLRQIRQIDPITYVWKEDRKFKDFVVPDADKQYHLGFNAQQLKNVIPEVVESWGWLHDKEQDYKKVKYSEIGVNYAEITPVVVNAVKELDKTQQKIIETLTISDFGVSTLINNQIQVDFADNFKQNLTQIPAVTVSPLQPGVSLYIASIDEKGFVVAVNGNVTSAINFNWIAMGKMNKENINTDFSYSNEEHQEKLTKMATKENQLPTYKDILSIRKTMQSEQLAPILTPEQQKLKEEAEKLRIKTKELEQKFEAENKKEMERIEKERLEKLKLGKN